jgi:hypothetical protein
MGNLLANIIASPKTTFLGFVGILTVIAGWVNAGTINFADINQIWMLAMSMGLVVAKDANVSNSPVPMMVAKVESSAPVNAPATGNTP